MNSRNLFKRTPYTVVSWISAFGDPNSISPVFATMPALCAKSQVIWNPIVIYIFLLLFLNATICH